MATQRRRSRSLRHRELHQVSSDRSNPRACGGMRWQPVVMATQRLRSRSRTHRELRQFARSRSRCRKALEKRSQALLRQLELFKESERNRTERLRSVREYLIRRKSAAQSQMFANDWGQPLAVCDAMLQSCEGDRGGDFGWATLESAIFAVKGCVDYLADAASASTAADKDEFIAAAHSRCDEALDLLQDTSVSCSTCDARVRSLISSTCDARVHLRRTSNCGR